MWKRVGFPRAWERGKRDQDVCYDSAEAQKPFFLKVIWEWNGVCLLADMLHYCLVFAHVLPIPLFKSEALRCV